MKQKQNNDDSFRHSRNKKGLTLQGAFNTEKLMKQQFTYHFFS